MRVRCVLIFLFCLLISSQAQAFFCSKVSSCADIADRKDLIFRGRLVGDEYSVTPPEVVESFKQKLGENETSWKEYIGYYREFEVIEVSKGSINQQQIRIYGWPSAYGPCPMCGLSPIKFKNVNYDDIVIFANDVHGFYIQTAEHCSKACLPEDLDKLGFKK